MKKSALQKATYRFNTMLIKMPMSFLSETGKTIIKFIWKHKRL
jgi:hypothetical protein